MPTDTIDRPGPEAKEHTRGKRGRAAGFLTRVAHAFSSDGLREAGVDARDPFEAATDKPTDVKAAADAVDDSRQSLERMGLLVNASPSGVVSPDNEETIRRAVRNTGEIPVIGGDNPAEQHIEVEVRTDLPTTPEEHDAVVDANPVLAGAVEAAEAITDDQSQPPTPEEQ